ncbi:MAG: efflux RND transporter periplasmic adaptor subunit [Prevotellaceae bacterium]|nr:efflux RND transporter periplasmic adaptor subunit [Prevotellaceae bacterium]
MSILFFCCSSDRKKIELIRPVKTGQVFLSASEPVDMLSGSVVAGSEASPSFTVPGLLKKIYVHEGEFVKTGALIAEIDAADYQSAAIAAESKYNQVNAEVGRVEELFKKNSVAKNEYEKAIAGRQSIASLYETTQNQLKATKLYAPISGIVQSIDAGLYQSVIPGVGVVTIVNTSTLSVQTNISSALLVKKNDFKSFVGYSNFVKEPVPLKLNYISPKANNNQLYKMLLDIDGKYLKNLAPGMSMEIKLTHQASKKQEFSISLQAVFNENGKDFVWIVDAEKMTVSKREISTENLNKEGRIVVLDGLDGSETIVTAGVSKLEEGQKIRILQQ